MKISNVTGTTGGWNQALNALAMYYGARITGNEGDHRLTNKDPDSLCREFDLRDRWSGLAQEEPAHRARVPVLITQ
jgi:hypothetical protein